MKKIIEVKHNAGRHCASTGISDVVNYHGVSWSEAMCFGVGAGLGIWYVNFPDMNPARMVHVRSFGFEEKFFKRAGVPFEWQQNTDPIESEKTLINCLDADLPAKNKKDIYYLPYYKFKAHFAGYVIVVFGYDNEKKAFFITDTEREELIEVPFDAMRKARYCSIGVYVINAILYASDKFSIPDDLPGIIREFILDNSRDITGDSYDFQGIAGLLKWRNEILEWSDLDDWVWTARFTYQIIEKRGTGGGGFRFMYADFLKEASRCLSEIESLGLHSMMHDTALAWQRLALELKETSDRDKPDFNGVRDKIDEVYQLESAYHEKALTLG